MLLRKQMSVLAVGYLTMGVGTGMAAPLINWDDSVNDQPTGWETQFHPDIPAHTSFEWKQMDSRWALEMQSSAGYGSMVYRFDKPVEVHSLNWDWRVDVKPEGADLRQKPTDDSAAKVCLFVQIDEGKLGLGTRLALGAARALSGQSLPSATLCYQWADQAEPNAVFPNPYTDRVVNFVLENRPASSVWKTEFRDLKADVTLAFGEELPDEVQKGKAPIHLVGIALGADADNTKGQTSAAIRSFLLK